MELNIRVGVFPGGKPRGIVFKGKRDVPEGGGGGGKF